MTTPLTPLLELLEAGPSDAEELDRACQSVPRATTDELHQFLHDARQLVAAHPDHDWRKKLSPVLMALLQWGHHNRGCVTTNDEAFIGEVVAFYRDLNSVDGPRHHLLTLLTTLRNRTALLAMAGALTTDPPQAAEAVCLPLMPLFKRPDREVLVVFPALLEALQNPHAAVGVLDLANYLAREKIADKHPVEPRFVQLVTLLEGVVSELDRLDDNPAETPVPFRAARERVQQATPLIVSICDALGLIGDLRAIPHLKHVMALRHRRLQVEAAAALARLGDEEGVRRLAQLAAEASVRLRVLRYADELDIADRIDQQHQEPVAMAEAELVTCLSEPNHFGLPPTSCELIDTRTLYWPGYEEPRVCYLFRFTYQVQRDDHVASFSNIGIAGPLTHVLHADVTHLAPESIYAAFAGWHAEHPLIFEVAVADWNLKQEHVAEDYCQRIGNADFVDVQPLLLGYVLQRLVLVAKARRNGQDSTTSGEGTVIVDDKEIHWYGIGNPQRPVGPSEAFWIDKGQQLLESFNECT